MGQSHIYLSDDRHHDTTYVKDNNEHLLPLLQQQRADMHMQPIKHVTYLSDGGPAHYKNARSFYNMTHVPNDLAPQPRGSTEPLKADWIFLGPNHGKNNWDGVTGIFKNKCRRACLNKRTVLESAHPDSILPVHLRTIQAPHKPPAQCPRTVAGAIRQPMVERQ
jgi:hypothetical protein